MSVVDGLVRRVDRAAQRRAWLAFPYAVLRKFGDDRGGNLAALLAYYAFVSVFPLLLLFTTVLGYALHGSPDLRERILHSALVEFPVIGDQLRTEELHGHWYVLVLSAAISLWGARGIATAAQGAWNSVWNVPYARRPGFLPALGRSLALLAVMGVAVVVTGLLSGIGESGDPLGILVRVGVFIASVAINVGVFLLGFRLATAKEVPLRCMVPGAVASAVVWQGLLVAGTLLVGHQVRHQQSLYGVFGVVLGLLAWLHLQAALTLYAVEADVVRTRRLWPRSMMPPPLTQGDRRAYRAYAETTRRRPEDEQYLDVRFPVPRSPALVPGREPVARGGSGDISRVTVPRAPDEDAVAQQRQQHHEEGVAQARAGTAVTQPVGHQSERGRGDRLGGQA
jgi:YihY family inner membrane protein